MPLNDVGSAPDPLSNEPTNSKRWVTDDILYEECERVYRQMFAVYDIVNGERVWEGTLHKLFEGKRHLYSPVMKTLYDAGCCHIVSRGARNRKTTVRLIKPPTIQDIKDARAETYFLEKERLSKRTKDKVQEQTINDMRIELQDLRNRVQILERKLGGN